MELYGKEIYLLFNYSLLRLGFKVNKTAHLPKMVKRKAKVESDSSSDEEWRPGVDEDSDLHNRKKLRHGDRNTVNEASALQFN